MRLLCLGRASVLFHSSGIGIPIEQCARTWSGDRLHYLTWEREAPGYHPLSLFLSFYFLGWVPPTSTNHRLQAHRVGPAHTLFSVIYATIPSRRPSVKDIVGYVKKFIYLYTRKISCNRSFNLLYKRYKQIKE